MSILKAVGATACLALCAAAVAAAQDAGKTDERPKLVVTARPSVALAPAQVVLTAQLVGGANDYEAYYCPTVVWDWDDGTQSESSTDCQPYEPGVSQIQRRYTTEHRFLAGSYRVLFTLKSRSKEVAAATVRVQVRSGAGPDEP
jgi:hypothetical protein